MSLHPSLKIDSAGIQQRSVLSRIERIKDLMKKGLWTEDHPVIGLPKTKIIRIKAKSKAKEEAEEGEGKEGKAIEAQSKEGKAKEAEAKPGTKK